jgi:phage baseplate assembly protein W
MATYKGFSTKFYGVCNTVVNAGSSIVYQSSPDSGPNVNFSLKDVNLVKQDILNNICTTKGSRVMQPSQGTIIPDLLFEPMDSTSLVILEDEITRVINADPRVSLLNLSITPNYDSNSVSANIMLQFIQLNMVSGFELNIQFE